MDTLSARFAELFKECNERFEEYIAAQREKVNSNQPLVKLLYAYILLETFADGIKQANSKILSMELEKNNTGIQLWKRVAEQALHRTAPGMPLSEAFSIARQAMNTHTVEKKITNYLKNMKNV